MKWWKKALIGTGILCIMVAVFAFILFRQIHQTSADRKIEDMRVDKLATLCGEIIGAGTVVIWVFSYKGKTKYNGNQ